MSRKAAQVPSLWQAVRFLLVSRLLIWTIWVIYRAGKISGTVQRTGSNSQDGRSVRQAEDSGTTLPNNYFSPHFASALGA